MSIWRSTPMTLRGHYPALIRSSLIPSLLRNQNCYLAAVSHIFLMELFEFFVLCCSLSFSMSFPTCWLPFPGFSAFFRIRLYNFRADTKLTPQQTRYLDSNEWGQELLRKSGMNHGNKMFNLFDPSTHCTSLYKCFFHQPTISLSLPWRHGLLLSKDASCISPIWLQWSWRCFLWIEGSASPSSAHFVVPCYGTDSQTIFCHHIIAVIFWLFGV